MNKEKQIEQVLGDIKVIIRDTIYSISNEDDRKYIAELLCDAGYRKSTDVLDEFIRLMIENFGVDPYDRMSLDVRYLIELKKKYESEKDDG